MFSGIGRLGTGLLCRPLSVHHTPIGTIPTQPIPKNTESFSIHCNIPQRRTVTCPERGSARGKSGLRNSERLSPSQTCPRQSVPPKGKPHCQSVPQKGKPHCQRVPPKGKEPHCQSVPPGKETPSARSVRQTPDIVQYLVQFSHYFYQ